MNPIYCCFLKIIQCGSIFGLDVGERLPPDVAAEVYHIQSRDSDGTSHKRLVFQPHKVILFISDILTDTCGSQRILISVVVVHVIDVIDIPLVVELRSPNGHGMIAVDRELECLAVFQGLLDNLVETRFRYGAIACKHQIRHLEHPAEIARTILHRRFLIPDVLPGRPEINQFTPSPAARS